MKKLVLMFVAIAAISFASCGNKPAAPVEEEAEPVDTALVDSLGTDSLTEEAPAEEAPAEEAPAEEAPAE